MESVRKRDGRSLDHKALEDIRIQAVQRVEAGEAPSAVMRVMGFARTVIYDWLNKYRAGGIEALRALPIPGRPPKLTDQQRAWVYRTVTQNNPLQLQWAHSRFPGHALTPTGVMAIRCKQFHLPDL